MSNITIVTAFFDIGRGSWTQSVQKNGGALPHYLERSREVYIERFQHLCKLDNEIVVFTSSDIAPQLEEIAQARVTRTVVVPVDIHSEFSDLKARIASIQADPAFIEKIDPYQSRNPEYWSADYVLVTMLKAHFVAEAIEAGLVNTSTAAWLDFGYCRSHATLANSKTWDYDFEPSKIHFWNCQVPNLENSHADIIRAILNNSVIIFGAMIVANRAYWRPLADAMMQSLEILMDNGLVDDDQGLWLMCYFGKPDAFELHPLDYNDPFIVFRDYNK